MYFCVLSPAHESEMRGYIVYLLIVKYLLSLLWNLLNWGFFKTVLEGSVDHIIYRDYIANRRSLT